MESIHIRNMLSIHWRKGLALFTLIFITSIALQAQYHDKSSNYLEYKNKSYYFGITMGFNSSRHFVQRSNDFLFAPEVRDSIRVIEGSQNLGFDVNGIVNFKVGENFDIRALPGFSFVTRSIDLNSSTSDDSGNRGTVNLESILVKFPFHVRYKSAPFKDKRAFVVTGLNYSFDVASNSKIRQELATDLIRLSPHDFQFEVGVGMQFFFPYFILSPEFKFSQGLNNSLIYGQSIGSRAIEKLNSRTFTISFHIEG